MIILCTCNWDQNCSQIRLGFNLQAHTLISQWEGWLACNNMSLYSSEERPFGAAELFPPLKGLKKPKWLRAHTCVTQLGAEIVCKDCLLKTCLLLWRCMIMKEHDSSFFCSLLESEESTTWCHTNNFIKKRQLSSHDSMSRVQPSSPISRYVRHREVIDCPTFWSFSLFSSSWALNWHDYNIDM